MNGPYRQPSKQEMRAMLQANAVVLTIYFAAIRATPLALDFGYAAYKHYLASQVKMLNILYFGAARVSDKRPIADYVVVESKEQPRSVFTQKFDRLLQCFHPEKRPRLTITDKDVGHIHYTSDTNILLMVICCSEYPQSLAFRLLTEATQGLQKELGDQISKSKAFGLSKQAKLLFKDLANKYQDPVRADKLARVVVEVEHVKNAMQQNIQAALKNQDNLETLLDTSDDMRHEAASFHRSTNQVKERMQWKNTKMWIFIIVLLLCLVAVAVVPILLHNKKEAQ